MAASEERVKPWRDLPWPDGWKVVWEHKAGHVSARAGVGAQGQAGKQGRGGSMGHLGRAGQPWGLGIAVPGWRQQKGNFSTINGNTVVSCHPTRNASLITVVFVV